MKKSQTVIIAFIFILLAGGMPVAATNLWLVAESQPDTPYALPALAARFLGLSMQRITGREFLNRMEASPAQLPAALIIDEVLFLQQTQICQCVVSCCEQSIPVLVRLQKTPQNVPSIKSGVPLPASIPISGGPRPTLTFSDRLAETHPLNGISFPVPTNVSSFGMADSSMQPLLYWNDTNKTPLFSVASNQMLYALAPYDPAPPPDDAPLFMHGHGFTAIAPYLVFLRQAFGTAVWHTPRPLANLTIDDPWLHEPYGPLSYHGLLKQMDAVNFHTTIAYIPWNWDRPSTPSVLQLFRDRPDRYSLCVHGNNNDHREFYRYRDDPQNVWKPKSLPEQEHLIRQAIARMDDFQRRTRVPVDRVMVFPHLIAPAQTLNILKRYNFLSTANAGNVPLDEALPENPVFWLRNVTGQYAGLASLDRHEPRTQTVQDIARNLFLGNPLLFVMHVTDFPADLTAFNPTAQTVNRLAPDITWMSLGNISRYLYRLRKTGEQSWEVLAYSPQIILHNPDPKSRTWNIRKIDNASIPVQAVTIDGASHPWELTDEGSITLTCITAPKTSTTVSIVYQSPVYRDAVKLDRKGLRITLLRVFAELRDRWLTTGWIGSLVQTLYYDSGLYRAGLKVVAASVFLLFICVLALAIFGRRRMLSRRKQAK